MRGPRICDTHAPLCESVPRRLWFLRGAENRRRVSAFIEVAVVRWAGAESAVCGFRLTVHGSGARAFRAMSESLQEARVKRLRVRRSAPSRLQIGSGDHARTCRNLATLPSDQRGQERW